MRMTTITLNVQESIAEGLQEIPEPELSDFLQRIVEEYRTRQEAALLAAPLSAEDIAAIQQGLDDAKAGRVREGATVLAELRQHAGLP